MAHHWEQAGVGDIPGYATHYQTVSRAGVYARNLGWIGYGLDFGLTATRITEACMTGTEEHCEFVKYKETGRLAGSIAVGNLGAGAGLYLCLALGATTGIGGIACGVILTTTGSVIGSSLGNDIGESTGEMIYQKVGNND